MLPKGEGWEVVSARYWGVDSVHIVQNPNDVEWRGTACERVAKAALAGNVDAVTAVLLCTEDSCLISFLRKEKE